MRIEAAHPEDAQKLTGIAFSAKRHWGYPERWMEVWKEILTVKPEFIATNEIFVAVVDNQPVGFYAFDQQGRKLNLSHMWILPEWMGRGLGRSLFLHAIERAKVLGFREFEIESDPNAESFYVRMGARRIATNFSMVEQQRRELPILIFYC